MGINLDEDVVRSLAAALAVEAQQTADPRQPVDEQWQHLTRAAFQRAGIPLPAERFEAAWRATWRCAFTGGNYSQDARRILAAYEKAA